MSLSDFTYRSYLDTLELILMNGYSFASYHNYTDFRLPCIMRHDIDFDVNAALRLAKLESGFLKELNSTFFVLLSTNYYNVFSRDTTTALNSILALGHEIGLHFDEKKYGSEVPVTIIDAVQEEAYILGRMLGTKIRAVSMHRPSEYTLEADYSFEGLKNSYSQVFWREFKYLSDSRMHWSENAESIIASGQHARLHILTHAFWYSDDEITTREKLLRFITSATQERYDNMANSIRDISEFVTREDIITWN